jgi:uncharacterized protein YaeQ
MALSATLHNFRIALSDSDRGVYEQLDLRVARHPSETVAYMLTRVLAYCLLWETDIAFSKGLASSDEPALWVRSLDGRVKLWIDVGNPAAQRLHKASKASERVIVCTHQDPAQLRRTLGGERIHRVEDMELLALPKALLDALEAQVDKRMDWEVVVSGGQLYLTCDGATHEAELSRGPLLLSD